ncbi:MAG: lantibiotic dehydratase [Methylococcaceae bacterium]|nr:lantibiotic dehydratase [Methylococcaceae bacterium]
MSAFELAPAAVVRVAGWPLETLQRLAAPRLAGQAASLDRADEASLAAYEEDYRQVLEDQRRYLWRVTAGDPRFRCALALSSPSLASRLKDGIAPERRNKRARHLEKSLYRYLARAVSRIEPHGLWIGVTLAKFCSRKATRVSPSAPRTYVAPELAPFRDLLRALGQREPYRSLGSYRLNPTLQGGDERNWRYARRGPDGRLTWRDLPASPLWGILQAELASFPATSLTTLRSRLAELVSVEVAGPLLDFALEAGLLIGGLQLSVRFESPWEALEQAEASLEGPEARAWCDACESIKGTCERLERYLDALLSQASGSEHQAASADEPILRANAAVREAIETLAQTLSLSCPAMPESLLRCDWAAPFRIRLGQDDRQRLVSLLEDWGHLEKQYNAAKRHELRTRRVLQASGESRGLMSAPADHGVGPIDGSLGQRTRDLPGSKDAHGECFTHGRELPQAMDGRFDDTTEVVIPVHREAGAEPGPPLGALVLRPGREGLRQPWVRGLSNVATATHARHAYHLRNLGDSLFPWFRAAFRDLERSFGIRISDLVYDHPGSPNVLARPHYTEAVVDPWGTTPGALSCEGARLVQGPHPAAALLQSGLSRMAAHVFTAMAVPPTDVVVERLMATSFNWQTSSPQPDGSKAEHEAEGMEQQRRRLSNGAIVEPRRTVLPEQDVEVLAAIAGAERFRQWRRLARSYRWPELVRISVANAPALLIPTDSPLALEVAFEGIKRLNAGERGNGVGVRVIVEEMVESPWLEGPEGHHIAEWVLPVRRTRHLWERHNGQLSSEVRNDANEYLQALSA